MKCPVGSVLAAVLFVGNAAGAQPLPTGLALRWDAPVSCPSAADVEAAVARLLGRPLAAGPRPCVASARVRPTRRGAWRLRLSIATSGRPRHRTLEGAACASVADAAALLLALSIDPDGAAVRPAVESPTPTPAVQPVPAASPPSAPPSAVAPAAAAAPPPAAPRAGPRLRWLVRASLLGDIGSLPAATFGPSLALGVEAGAWRVEARFGFGVPQRTELDARGGEFALFTAGVTACGLVPNAPIVVGGCGGVELGSLRGVAYGVTQPSSGAAPWIAATFGAMARLSLSPRVGLVAELGGAVPLVRRRYVIDGLGAVFVAEPAVARGALGVEVSF